MPHVKDPVYTIAGERWHNPTPPKMENAGIADVHTKVAIDVLLPVATKVELQQVLRLLKPLTKGSRIIKTTKGPETYYIGIFGIYTACVFRTSMGSQGPTGSTLAVAAAIELWRPRCIIMPGIGFGASRDQAPGDILLADKIIPYESARIQADDIVVRAPIPPTGPTLINRFENAIDWSFKRPDKKRTTPKIIRGAVLSGEKLVDDALFKQRLLEKFPTAIGGEMEASGIWAASARNRAEWIVVKGICDWADGHKHKGFQELAAAASVSLCHYVLSETGALEGL